VSHTADEAIGPEEDGHGGSQGPIADDELRMAQRLLAVLDTFRMVRHTIPVHLVSALLLVATDEGKSGIHYARKSGVSPSVMSRHLIDLSDAFRNGDAGLGLIERRKSRVSLREQEVYLSPAGRKVVRQALAILMHGKAPANDEEGTVWLPV